MFNIIGWIIKVEYEWFDFISVWFLLILVFFEFGGCCDFDCGDIFCDCCCGVWEKIDYGEFFEFWVVVVGSLVDFVR